MTRNCVRCGIEFRTYPCRIKRGGGFFCSIACKNKDFHEKHRGHLSPLWRGGRRISVNGYVILTIETKQLYEHRVVMEKKLGRALRRDEHIHHVNGDKADNRLKNLKLMSAGEHCRHHYTGTKQGPYRTYKGIPLDPAKAEARRAHREYTRAWRKRRREV